MRATENINVLKAFVFIVFVSVDNSVASGKYERFGRWRFTIFEIRENHDFYVRGTVPRVRSRAVYSERIGISA